MFDNITRGVLVFDSITTLLLSGSKMSWTLSYSTVQISEQDRLNKNSESL